MIFVALLRGINVGGKNTVPMARLAETFRGAGCTEVQTYINSGNVIFCDARPATTLQPLLQTAISKDFGFDVPIVLRNQADIRALNSAIPASWTNDTAQKTDVMFLWDTVDVTALQDRLTFNPDIEDVRLLPGAIVARIDRQHVTRGFAVKLVRSDIYASMTVRNINTVRKLDGLMTSMERL